MGIINKLSIPVIRAEVNHWRALSLMPFTCHHRQVTASPFPSWIWLARPDDGFEMGKEDFAIPISFFSIAGEAPFF